MSRQASRRSSVLSLLSILSVVGCSTSGRSDARRFHDRRHHHGVDRRGDSGRRDHVRHVHRRSSGRSRYPPSPELRGRRAAFHRGRYDEAVGHVRSVRREQSRQRLGPVHARPLGLEDRRPRPRPRGVRRGASDRADSSEKPAQLGARADRDRPARRTRSIGSNRRWPSSRCRARRSGSRVAPTTSWARFRRPSTPTSAPSLSTIATCGR